MTKHRTILFCNLIRVKNPSLYGLRSNSQVLLVPPSTKTKKTLGDRTFTAAAPSLWNKLPCAIREEDNFNHFKSKLKTFLFGKAFELIALDVLYTFLPDPLFLVF